MADFTLDTEQLSGELEVES